MPLIAVATRCKVHLLFRFKKIKIVFRDVEVVVGRSLSCDAIAQIAIICYELNE